MKGLRHSSSHLKNAGGILPPATPRTRCLRHPISPPRTAPPPDILIVRVGSCLRASGCIGSFPVGILSGGPGQIWASSKDRNNRRRASPPPPRQEGQMLRNPKRRTSTRRSASPVSCGHRARFRLTWHADSRPRCHCACARAAWRSIQPMNSSTVRPMVAP
jgi:hypothetical protein